MTQIDPTELGASEHVLTAPECAAVAARAAALVDLGSLDRAGDGTATMLWRNAVCEAWLNTWWEGRDSGFHDHDGSSGGVFVLEGSVRGESLVVGSVPRRVVDHDAGSSFCFEGDAIHRVDHLRGAVTIHVYSPPLRSIGHYELLDGELRRTPCSPDEISAASDHLTAALDAH